MKNQILKDLCVASDNLYRIYETCDLCPHNCRIDRRNRLGKCLSDNQCRVSAAMPHHWEEPIICNKYGSGTVFFSSCTLKCVYCQNCSISHSNNGTVLTSHELAKLYLKLQNINKVCNINLVTAEHYIPHLVRSIKEAKNLGLNIPIILNTSSFLSVKSLKYLEGLIDIYLPDLKFYSNTSAKIYAKASNYPHYARLAIDEMFRQQSKLVFDNKGLLINGIIVRILLLPGQIKDAMASIAYLYTTYGDDIYISIMNQYTPLSPLLKNHPEINRQISDYEYNQVLDFAQSLGISNCFVQEGGANTESFIPNFNKCKIKKEEI